MWMVQNNNRHHFKCRFGCSHRVVWKNWYINCYSKRALHDAINTEDHQEGGAEQTQSRNTLHLNGCATAIQSGLQQIWRNSSQTAAVAIPPPK